MQCLKMTSKNHQSESKEDSHCSSARLTFIKTDKPKVNMKNNDDIAALQKPVLQIFLPISQLGVQTSPG